MKALGHDSIGTKIIHLCPDIFAENLSKIFNNAILQGVYPDAMKMKKAKVIALFKGGIKSNPNNYRPISVISHYGWDIRKKILQKIHCIFGAKTDIILSPIRISKIVHYSNGVNWDYRQYQAYSWRNELCNWNIHWFQEGIWYCWSWNYVEKIRLSWCSGAFKYGLQIISDYRRQFNVTNGVQSDIVFVKCGVPQGSVLGPLFFLLYINDLYRAVGCNAVKLFADDTSLLS